jgi:hypothetical protein
MTKDHLATLRQLARDWGPHDSTGQAAAWAIEEIDRLRADISQAYDLRDKAEGRYCTALGEIERLREVIRTTLTIKIPTETMEQQFAVHYRRGYEAGRAALKSGVELSPSEAASFSKTLARSPRRIPLPPEVLADAHQDVVHQDTGPVRAGRSVKLSDVDPTPENLMKQGYRSGQISDKS